MFVGEAPGRNEDLEGVPFVGAAGHFLDELLQSIGLERSQVYIANVVKCRPPGNRDPVPLEIDTCTPFLRRQIELIGPRVVATLGRFSAHWLLDTAVPISALRGRLYHVGDMRVVPVFHPAAALYDASKRDVLFEDFKRLRAVCDDRRDEAAGARAKAPDAPVATGVARAAQGRPPAEPSGTAPESAGPSAGGPGQSALF
jgi:DNA polymerase